MDQRALETLVAVTETGSFRAAARTLGYTQSAVSHQIATLESRIGGRLFHRSSGRRHVELTAVGEVAYRRAQRVLAEVSALDADIAALLSGDSGTIRIGLSQSACFLLADPLAALRRHSPGVIVSLLNAGTAETLAQQLARGQVDLGLFINIEADERIATIPLFDDGWVVITHSEDAIANQEVATVDVLDGADVIAWHQRWRAQARLEQYWRERGIKPRIVYRTDDNLMIQRLVVAQLGYACIGGLAAQNLIDPQLRRVRIRDELPPRTVSLCYAREREPTPAMLLVMDTVRRLARPAAMQPTDGHSSN